MKRLALAGIVGAIAIGAVGAVVWSRQSSTPWIVQAQDVPGATAQCWPYRRQMELAGKGLGVEESLMELEAVFGPECAGEPDVISQRQLAAECLGFRREMQAAGTDADRAIWAALVKNCPS